MLLSMSLLSDYLRDYRQEISIHEDSMSIRGLRHIPTDGSAMNKGYVYICSCREYFTSSSLADTYMLVNERSFLIFHDCDYETLLNDVLSAFEYYMNWELSLARAAAGHAPLDILFDLAAPVLRTHFYLCEEDGGLLNYRVESSVPKDSTWQKIAGQGIIDPYVMGKKRYDKNGVEISDFGTEPMIADFDSPQLDREICCYLTLDEDQIAFLAIDIPSEQEAVRLLQLAGFVREMFAQAGEFTLSTARIRSAHSLLTDLTDGVAVSEAAIEKFLRKAPRRPWRLMRITNAVRTDGPYRKAMLRIFDKMPEYCTAYEFREDVCVLISLDFMEQFLQNLRTGFDCTGAAAGVSVPFDQPETLPLRYRQASFALAEDRCKPGIRLCEDYAFDYLIRTLAEQERTRELLHPAPDILQRYDDENNTELRKTLFCYLQNSCRLLETADQLFIHRNSLKYRLNRIKELTGIDWEDRREMDYLILSVYCIGQGYAENGSAAPKRAWTDPGT